MDFIQLYQWHIFIFLEVSSWAFLLGFLLLRYAFDKLQLSRVFLALFLSFIMLEAVLALIIYRQTGQIDTFQIVIMIFIIYACTFGMQDFKKLDRYIKTKVGNWRQVDLLTEKDKIAIEKQRDPKRLARRNRIWSYGHTFVFLLANIIFWQIYGNESHSFTHYLTNWSWFDEDEILHAPYKNEMVMHGVKLWIIIYVVDTFVAWSYTIFPAKS